MRQEGSGAGASPTRETLMELTFIRKWSESGTGNCPALYRAVNETAVEVPAEVIAGILGAA